MDLPSWVRGRNVLFVVSKRIVKPHCLAYIIFIFHWPFSIDEHLYLLIHFVVVDVMCVVVLFLFYLFIFFFIIINFFFFAMIFYNYLLLNLLSVIWFVSSSPGMRPDAWRGRQWSSHKNEHHGGISYQSVVLGLDYTFLIWELLRANFDRGLLAIY